MFSGTRSSVDDCFVPSGQQGTRALSYLVCVFSKRQFFIVQGTKKCQCQWNGLSKRGARAVFHRQGFQTVR